MAFSDLRAFLRVLRERGEMVDITEEVDPRHEIAAYIRKTSDIQGPALFFANVRGHSMPVVGGVFSTRQRALLALEVDNSLALAKFTHALQHPIPTAPVEEGVCQEVVYVGDQVDLGNLPIPTQGRLDPGPYILAGIQISQDPDTGSRNASIYRMEVKGRNRLALSAHAFQDISVQFSRAESRGQPLEVAVAIGVDPVISLATQAKVPYGYDELALAGGLRGEAVQVVRCRTVDLWVPATSEIVIEGRVLPGIREIEGPFGEFGGYYGPTENDPIMEVTAVTHRHDAFFQTVLTGIPITENHVMKELPYEAALFADLKRVFPNVCNVHYAPAGGAQHLAIVALDQKYKGEARNVILAALGHHSRPKYVFLVDEDVDIYDMNKVVWAMVFRSQPDRDVIIIPRVAGGPRDPSTLEPDVTAVMGFDATEPIGENFPPFFDIPGVAEIKIPGWTD
jgi:4-hydroxy-3-polyprenylbenzoate decarboxylase/2,5-furandicarboxylate decarboxylase 1